MPYGVQWNGSFAQSNKFYNNIFTILYIPFFFYFRVISVVARAYYSFCLQGSFPVKLGNIEPRSVTYKARTLLAIFSLQPQLISIFTFNS